ncbi:FG-GAP repeat domain-containing protein [candidate division KSB1 bacterium]
MDWNNDGKFDLLPGDTDGAVWIFINIGTKEKPVLAEGVNVKANGKMITNKQIIYKQVDGKIQIKDGSIVIDKTIPGNHELSGPYSKLHYADWDNDGLKDLVIGTDSGEIFFYKNKGSAQSPKLGNAKEIKLESGEYARSGQHRLEITDWNNDGKIDLLVGERRRSGDFDGGYIWLFLGK